MINYHHTTYSQGSSWRLYYNHYVPEKQPVKATMLIVHGMKEHSGRYQALAEYLVQHGVAVITYDHVGHGNSVENEYQLGFFRNIDPHKLLVEHADEMADKLSSLHLNVPHYILGHSMGSFITRLLLQKSHSKFSGAIIVGTGGKNIAAQLTKPLFGLLNKVSPTKVSTFINETFDKMNNVRFKNEPGASSTSWLSFDRSNRESFDKDPFCGVPFSNNGFYALITLNTLATERDWAKSIAYEFPMLFISGEDDPIGDFGKGIRRTVLYLINDGFKNISYKLYPKMRHEILNESINKDIYDNIVNWIESI